MFQVRQRANQKWNKNFLIRGLPARRRGVQIEFAVSCFEKIGEKSSPAVPIMAR
jgi:hypothetical protein